MGIGHVALGLGLKSVSPRLNAGLHLFHLPRRFSPRLVRSLWLGELPVPARLRLETLHPVHVPVIPRPASGFAVGRRPGVARVAAPPRAPRPERNHRFRLFLHLKHRVLILKSALSCSARVQRKTQTGTVNPTLTELAQAPCGLFFRQCICDLGQVCCVAHRSEAILLLGKFDSGSLRCAATYS